MTGTKPRQLNILISGAGIAGLTAAHFLLRAGHTVTILERASSLRASGQNIDVRGHGLTVLQRMKSSTFDAEAAVKVKVTKEQGLRFVDDKNQSWADFPVGDGTAFTGEIEIMRGDLANILYDSIKDMPNLNMVYGKKIEAIQQQSSSGQVLVEVSDNWPSSNDKQPARLFDLVIAADGITSSTRSIAFGPEISNEAIKPLRQWSCWFSIPWHDTDSTWARWYNATRGRMILIRPDRANGDLTRVSLWTMTRDSAIEDQLSSLLKTNSISQQKSFWTELFTDAGWEAPRVLDGMQGAEDFHMQKIAQIKTPAWSHLANRTVLVGDAAYCPSPVSGMGVTSAMMGAYVLAGEINENTSDLSKAFQQYEEKVRPFIKTAQQLAPGTPGAANPEGTWGIWMLHCFLGLVAWTKSFKFMGAGVNPPAKESVLPEYGVHSVTAVS